MDSKVDQEPSRDFSHVVHTTLRLYGCPWEAIKLGLQLHPNKLGERDVNDDLLLHISCAQAPYFLERDNKKNVPNVIVSLLSLHGDATILPNRNGSLLIGLLIESGSGLAYVVGIVLHVNPAALLYENIGLSGFEYIILRVVAEECLTFIFRFLQDIPMIVGQ